MQVVEKVNDGLKRELEVIISADSLAKELDDKLEQAKSTVQLKGFRPGKVPSAYLRKTYAKSFMAEIINEKVSALPAKILEERHEKPALRPEISLSEDQAVVARILDGKEDAKILLTYEVLPQVEIRDFSHLEVNRQVVEVSQSEKDSKLEEVLETTREFKEKKSAAALGDRVTLDYLGKVDGKAFENGVDQNAQLVLGSNRFIPGFEEQLIGVKKNDEKTVTVTFPSDYGVSSLSGKAATFDVKIKKVESASEIALNDESAKKLGAESLEQLKNFVIEQLENKYGSVTRQKIKRQVLDFFDSEYDFVLPQSLVEMELNNIKSQVQAEESRDEAAINNDHLPKREEYEALARRRVKLGLILGEIGAKENIKVSKEELHRALFQQLQYFPGEEKKLLDLFQHNPNFVESLRAPIFEDKVIDYILANVKIHDSVVAADDLMKDDEALQVKEKTKKKGTGKKATQAASVEITEDMEAQK